MIGSLMRFILDEQVRFRDRELDDPFASYGVKKNYWDCGKLKKTLDTIVINEQAAVTGPTIVNVMTNRSMKQHTTTLELEAGKESIKKEPI